MESSADTGNLSIGNVLSTFWDRYNKTNPKLIKIIDIFLAFYALTAAALFVFVLIVGRFPFNSFLAAFFAAIGMFVLTVNLRVQVHPHATYNAAKTPYRAFGNFAFCSLLLFVSVFNYLG